MGSRPAGSRSSNRLYAHSYGRGWRRWWKPARLTSSRRWRGRSPLSSSPATSAYRRAIAGSSASGATPSCRPTPPGTLSAMPPEPSQPVRLLHRAGRLAPAEPGPGHVVRPGQRRGRWPPLELDEILGYCFVMIAGGNDTAGGLLGGAAVALCGYPDQRRLLVDDPGPIRWGGRRAASFHQPGAGSVSDHHTRCRPVRDPGPLPGQDPPALRVGQPRPPRVRPDR